MKNGLRPTLIRLPMDLLRRAKKAAVDRDTTLQKLVAEALAAHLNRKQEARR